jgi:hypothetical protein
MLCDRQGIGNPHFDLHHEKCGQGLHRSIKSITEFGTPQQPTWGNTLTVMEGSEARSRGDHATTSDQARYGRGRTATHKRACGSAGRPRTRSACAAGQRSWPGPGPVGRDLNPGSEVMTKPRGPASSARSALLQAFLCASIPLAGMRRNANICRRPTQISRFDGSERNGPADSMDLECGSTDREIT